MLPNAMQAQVSAYYAAHGIHPLDFRCVHQAFCRRYAKCSMNNPGKEQAAGPVHQRCSDSYLLGEVTVLQPDILITQGRRANAAIGALFPAQAPQKDQLPAAHRVCIGGRAALWLLMAHPARGGTTRIRAAWPFYRRQLSAIG